MSYVDLGKYQFVTGADYTGLNAGNLTSVLQTSSLRIPYFELYRLLINTSQVPIPGALPVVVQQTPLATGTSLTALDLAFPADTTAGNTVVVGVANSATVDNPSVSGITLGGSADNFGVIGSAGGAHGDGYSALWVDPHTAEASTALVVTMTGGSGTILAGGMAWELSGMLDTSTPGDAWDFFASNFTTDQALSSLATPNEPGRTANDYQVGFGIGYEDVSGFTLAGPPAPWSNVTSPVKVLSSGFWAGFIGSSQQLGVAGSNTTWPVGVSSGLAHWSLSTAGLLPTATPPAAAPFSFTVAIDGVTWDQEQTVAGVGYTYNIGQSPLYLNTGQTIQILWDLPAATYAAYSGQFNITGWFRYDPSVQPS